MAPIKSNNPFASYFDFFSKSGLDAVTPEPPPPSGLTATGGIISDYESSGTYYRAHLFTSSGTFVVSAIGDLPSNVAILAAGGGGGGVVVLEWWCNGGGRVVVWWWHVISRGGGIAARGGGG